MTDTLFNLAGEALAEDQSYEAQAEVWAETHPIGMALFEQFARDMIRDYGRVGWKAVAERVRDAPGVERVDGEFKVNNNLVTYIGQILEERHPWIAEYVGHRKRTHG